MNKKNFKRSFMYFTLVAVLASTQIAQADGLANASINSTQGGFVGMENGVNSATLNFNGNSHVNWNTLNVNSNETLNFNAVDGASGLTILNTVSGPVSHIFGTINSNPGISKLIISNPNGLMFDGSSFNAAGDVMLTTQKLAPQMNANGVDMDGVLGVNQVATQAVYTRNNASFNIGGTFNIVGPKIFLTRSTINAPRLRLITQNGQDFLVNNYAESASSSTLMRAVSVNGNVFIVSGKDTTTVNTGTNINGRLDISSQGSVNLNYNTLENCPTLQVGSLHVDTTGEAENSTVRLRNVRSRNAADFYLRNQNGDVIVRDINANTSNTVKILASNDAVLLGNNSIYNDAIISAGNNIIIGNHNIVPGQSIPGSLFVGGPDAGLVLNAPNGNVLIKDNVGTIHAGDTTINSGKNILTAAGDSSVDGETPVISGMNFTFNANGYIGAIEDSDALDNIMNNDAPIEDTVKGYMNCYNNMDTTVNGSEVRINAKNYIDLKGNADVMYITSTVDNANSVGGIVWINSDTEANEIIIGEETGYLMVPSEQRNYDLKFTNIRDNAVTEIAGDEAITYEDFNASGGYNDGEHTRFNTWVVAPSEPSRAQSMSLDKSVAPTEPNKAQTMSSDRSVSSALKTVPSATKKKQ